MFSIFKQYCTYFLNTCFQFLNNIVRIFTYFFIHTYFQKIQTTLLEQRYQMASQFFYHGSVYVYWIEINVQIEYQATETPYPHKHLISKGTRLGLVFLCMRPVGKFTSFGVSYSCRTRTKHLTLLRYFYIGVPIVFFKIKKKKKNGRHNQGDENKRTRISFHKTKRTFIL